MKSKMNPKKLKNIFLYLIPSLVFPLILIIRTNTVSQDIDSICIYLTITLAFLIGFCEKKSGIIAFLLAPFICILTNIILLIHNPNIHDYKEVETLIGIYSIFYLIFFVSAIFLKACIKESKKSKVYIVPLVAIALFLIFNLNFLENNVGSPLKRIYEKQLARSYINEKYGDMSEYKVTGLEYYYYWFEGADIPTFKIHFKVPDSKDKYFTVNGEAPLFSAKITYDNFKHINDGSNTTGRIRSEYRDDVNDKIEKIIEENFRDGYIRPSLNVNINESDLSIFKYYDEDEEKGNPAGKEIIEKAVIDKTYDIYDLGEKAGVIRVCIEEWDPSLESASNDVIQIKKILDENNIGFSVIYLYIQDSEAYDRKADYFVKIKKADISDDKFSVMKKLERLSTLESNFVFSGPYEE